jgi:hypothetical protein
MTSEGSAALHRAPSLGPWRSRSTKRGDVRITSIGQVVESNVSSLFFLAPDGNLSMLSGEKQAIARDHCTGADAFRCLKVSAEPIPGEAA